MGSRFYAKLKQALPKIATTAVICGSFGSFLVEILPNSIYLNYYKQLLQSTRYGEDVPLTEKALNLFNEVLNDLKINENDRKLYQPFACSGFEVLRAGFPSKYGAIIGLPVNYLYKNNEVIDSPEIRIGYNQEKLNMYHPSAHILMDSLFLSDKAKKYGIAREILMSNTYLPLYRSLESPVIITTAVLAAEYLRLQLQKSMIMSISLKSLIFLVMGSLGYSIWFQIRDTLNRYYETSVDAELAELNLAYIEGGKEFYEKHLQKNIALRALLGERGIKEYNQDGDKIIKIRRKSIPFTERKNFFINCIIRKNKQEQYAVD